MEPAERKKKILSAVVEYYVAEGEPIGSKALIDKTGLNVSSATVRNELAELTSMGLLIQPHTSAGRIPTTSGYRYYINKLMRVVPVSQGGRDYIASRLEESASSPEAILEHASKLLARLTGCAAAATTPFAAESRVHRLRFVQIGSHTAMAVLIVSSGVIKTRLFRCDFEVTTELLAVLDRALNKLFAGMKISSVNRPFVQTAAARLGELSVFAASALTVIMDACESAEDVSVYLNGASRLLYYPEMGFAGAQRVMEFFASKHDLAEMLESLPQDTSVSLGTENSRVELSSSAVISTRYRLDGNPSGVLAVIAPMRTDYARTTAIIECVSENVGSLIGGLIEI